MEVVKYNSETRERIKCEYPNIDINSPIIGLDSEIEYFEIVRIEPEPFNEKQFAPVEIITLTDKVSQYGEHLKIAEISIQLNEREKSDVIKDFNDTFGKWIDEVYPMWKRVKDLSFSTTDGEDRQQREADVRNERQQREDDYINNDIFPNFKFEWL